MIARRPQNLLSLSPVLRCPYRRCEYLASGLSGDLLTVSCRKCGGHWWAMRLEPGDVRAQLRRHFNEDDTVVEFLDALGAPATLAEPMYWQVCISKDEHYQFVSTAARRGMPDRTRDFFRSIRP